MGISERLDTYVISNSLFKPGTPTVTLLVREYSILVRYGKASGFKYSEVLDIIREPMDSVKYNSNKSFVSENGLLSYNSFILEDTEIVVYSTGRSNVLYSDSDKEIFGDSKKVLVEFHKL